MWCLAKKKKEAIDRHRPAFTRNLAVDPTLDERDDGVEDSRAHVVPSVFNPSIEPEAL